MNSYVFAAILAVLMLLGFTVRRNPHYSEVRDKIVTHHFLKKDR